MRFQCTDEFRGYMNKRKRSVISVEVARSDHSDFEVTELYVRLVTDAFAVYLVRKKGYDMYLLEGGGLVLLPPYHLEIDEVVTFSITKHWIFRCLSIDGIRL